MTIIANRINGEWVFVAEEIDENVMIILQANHFCIRTGPDIRKALMGENPLAFFAKKYEEEFKDAPDGSIITCTKNGAFLGTGYCRGPISEDYKGCKSLDDYSEEVVKRRLEEDPTWTIHRLTDPAEWEITANYSQKNYDDLDFGCSKAYDRDVKEYNELMAASHGLKI